MRLDNIIGNHSQCPSRRTSAPRVGPETPILKQAPPRHACRGLWSDPAPDGT
ncbi:hypothetical protein HNR02_006348 [Amycolatopsis endophytica]|uniref:Uncharacterized protein n=1 Tax=Amycolatopsis endophytica TaxID=860233 RepID=A0A853BC71_9PSEU|nr:hypothetical protein [Amycolatopsis endophytica]